jgi:predicted SnoaL-like aldol condensation-catalyzing enzyme
LKYLIEEWLQKEIRWQSVGKQQVRIRTSYSAFLQPEKITVTGIDLFRVAGGKLVELWLSWDQLGMMQQLGILPPPE